MRTLIIIFVLFFVIPFPVSATEFVAPEVPEVGAKLMPAETENFSAALLEMLQKAVHLIRPDLKEAASASLSVITVVMMLSVLRTFSCSILSAANLAGTTLITAVLLLGTNSLILLGANTVTQISNYGKLFLPVMTSALAAQGQITASAALYAGSSVFITFLSNIISRILLPIVYLFLALSVAASATGEEILKNARDMVKNAVSWCLKTILTVFTTYISVTGIVSGTTDAVTLKATKVTISSVVPVVGGILSEASEAVLVSAGLMKSAAGVYGILAILAIFLEPFLRIGSHYLLLRLTAAVCAVFGIKTTTDLISDFSSAMGLLLAMTGAVCLILLISTVCFMKGVG